MLNKLISVYLGTTIPYGFYCGYTSKNLSKESLYSTKIFSGTLYALASPVAIPCSMLTIVERLERRIRNIEDTDAESEDIY